MRRPIQIMLVLMGGGLAAGAAVSLLTGDNCPPEDPNCSTGSGRSGYSSSYSSGGHSSGSAGAVAGAAAGAAVGTAVARGGFGSSGSHYSSSGG